MNNRQIDRLDLNDAHLRVARERGARLVIATDAHAVTSLGTLQWGVRTARRAWATPADVPNTRRLQELRALLRRSRRAA